MFCPDCQNFLVITDLIEETEKKLADNNISTIISSDYDLESEEAINTTKNNKNQKKINDDEINVFDKSYYYCNNCGYTDTIKNNTIIYNKKTNQIDNEIIKKNYLNYKYDNTLPTTKNYNCINEKCKTHKNPEIKNAVFYRNSLVNYNLIYVCSVCDSFWKN
jgi:hypothetical protein